MLGPEGCDDHAYAELLQTIANTGNLPERIKSGLLRKMIARGLGIGEVCAEREKLCEVFNLESCIPALSYDLTFPEVFYPTGVPHGRNGFHAAVGNPPWDAIKFNSKEFFASFDFEVLNAPTQRERTAIEERLALDLTCGPVFEQYKEEFEQQKRVNDQLYNYQKVYIEGDLAGRQADAFRVFMERNAQLLTQTGWTGVVVPSAFHANEGATGVRRLYLQELNLRHCYSFENRRKLFEIDSRFKFATVVANAGKPTDDFHCAFYLHDDEWLFDSRRNSELLSYTREFVNKTGRAYLTFLELRDITSANIATAAFSHAVPFGEITAKYGIRFQTSPVSLHMSHDAHRFRDVDQFKPNGEDPRLPENRQKLLQQGLFYLSEGKTFHQFDETWGDRPRYCVPLDQLEGNPLWLHEGRFYRCAFRAIASSTNERTSIFCMLSPGTVSGNSVGVERHPHKVPRATLLWLQAITNSHSFDWCLRLMTSANVNLFIMNGAPVIADRKVDAFLVHCALRLTCNHAGYAPLWKEQLGDAWQEVGNKPLTWPVLAGDDERWAVRAALDAVVADAYGLSREQYAHVLSTFSHASYKKAPELCLARFDELKQIGLEAFTKKHDPYWDIPLNENLPKPVIDLPIPNDLQVSLFANQEETKPKKRTRKKAQG
jgi:hypothetical protein